MLNGRPVFSVIIPTYNRARIINRAVNSVLNQTFKDFELLVVDDGSKDNTEEVISGLKDERIQYVKHIKNQGQNPALNTGLAHAKGTYVSFLDSDDEWLPEMLEKQYGKFQESDDYDCVYSRCLRVDIYGSRQDGHQFNLEGYIYKQALEQGYVSSMISLSVKRSCFQEIGNFDINFRNCQDDDICLRLAKKYRFGLIKEPLAIIYCDAGEQVTSNKSEYAMGWWRLVNKHQADIRSLCGNKTLSDHYLKCASLFLLAKMKKDARDIAVKTFAIRPTVNGLILLSFSFFPIFLFSNYTKLVHKVKSLI
jgi:glycosyltransferase involved in cell wall biosynthesis